MTCRRALITAWKAGQQSRPDCDNVTSAPAYQITESGRQYLAKYAGEHGADEPEQQNAAEDPAPAPAQAPAGPIALSLIRQKDARDREIDELRGQLYRIWLMLGIDTPLRSDGQEIEQSVAEVLHKLAAQPQPCAYVVQRPAKPLVRFNKIDNAQARAMVFARGGKATKVFALVPVGTAIPGAEWRNA
jgi:hypothetical protein